MSFDRAAIEAWTAQNIRTIREYETCPQTHCNTPGPCINDCGRTAYTQRGICRACLRDKKGNR